MAGSLFAGIHGTICMVETDTMSMVNFSTALGKTWVRVSSEPSNRWGPIRPKQVEVDGGV